HLEAPGRDARWLDAVRAEDGLHLTSVLVPVMDELGVDDGHRPRFPVDRDRAFGIVCSCKLDRALARARHDVDELIPRSRDELLHGRAEALAAEQRDIPLLAGHDVLERRSDRAVRARHLTVEHRRIELRAELE